MRPQIPCPSITTLCRAQSLDSSDPIRVGRTKPAQECIFLFLVNIPKIIHKKIPSELGEGRARKIRGKKGTESPPQTTSTSLQPFSEHQRGLLIRKSKLVPMIPKHKTESNKLSTHMAETLYSSEISACHSPCPAQPPLPRLHCNSSIPNAKPALTHNLDNLSQEDAVCHILLEVLDETFVARLG